MIIHNNAFWWLVICSIGNICLMFSLIFNKNKKKLHRMFILNCFLTLVWSASLIAQILLSPYNIPLTKFANITYIGACIFPVSLLLTSIVYANPNAKLSKKYLLLFIIPIISLIVLWTNDKHNLFFINYSINIAEDKFGSYFIVHTLYSYICIAISLIMLIKYAIKHLGFFSLESMFLIIGTLVPTITNVLGSFSIVHMTIYVTPITYIASLFCYSFAMLWLKSLRTSPIALQHIVNRISDAYVVLDAENNIITFNKAFLDFFDIKEPSIINGLSIFELKNKFPKFEIPNDTINEYSNQIYKNRQTIHQEFYLNKSEKYFSAEFIAIVNKGSFMGTILLLKDITQHKQDMETIQNNQSQLIEQERLASLGQMIGGIAHNLKTPIMSISGASEGLKDLVKEYDISIGNPVVTENDFHDIAKDMNEWIGKINNYTSYMSDIITAVKGQAVQFSNDNEIKFTVSELFKRVNILMKHDLKNAIVYLNTRVDMDENTVINGDVNSLVQVIDNMISNSIQAYNGIPEQSIELVSSIVDNKVVISIEDHAGGLPEKVKNKLFKEMITTKGKNGTGLGLYMSYSNIKAHFKGDITFESQDGIGTKFNIIIPL